MKKIIVFISLLFLISSLTRANIINIPADYGKIQQGVNNAAKGDTVLVAAGTYYENISLKGKNIVLASQFLLNKDTSFIKSTIIDGSKPIHADTASCILIFSGEDSTTVIEGFTLTGGKGTVWPDVEYGGFYREGGGILIDNASPTIRNNFIVNNWVDNKTGVSSSGGGGIRIHKSFPHVMCNLIMGNKGNYGGAIVMYYSGGKFNNNIIIGNITGADYGGGNIWISQNYSKPRIFDNNTIVGNISGAAGSGIYINATDAILYNNIIWGNYQSSGNQVLGSRSAATYNCTENIIAGDGNINEYPLFSDSNLVLKPISPCIDSGNPASEYADVADNLNIGFAKNPSLGKTRNDIGAYGGPNAKIFPSFEFFKISLSTSLSLGTKDTIDSTVFKKLPIVNQSTISIQIDSVKKSANSQLTIKTFPKDTLMPMQSDTVSLQWTPQNDIQYNDSILIYHNLKNISNPIKVIISGKAKTSVSIKYLTKASYININPNPFKESAIIQYSGIMPNSHLVIYDLNGKVIRTINIQNARGDVTLNRDDLTPGVYLYKLKSDKTILNGKFVIAE